MGKLILVAVIVVLFSGAAWASQPGQPLSTEDWEVLDVSVTSWFAPGSGQCGRGASVPPFPDTCFLGSLRGDPKYDHFSDPDQRYHPVGPLIDAAGNAWGWKRSDGQPGCGSGYAQNTDLYRCSPVGTCEVVARLPGRCVDPGNTSGYDGAVVHAMWIDNTSGYLYVRYRSTLEQGNPLYLDTPHIDRFAALPTLFEIFQTYTPTATDLAFRVPAHPEGLRSADHFDTYCEANYSVTAVAYGADQRYGRRRIGGVMSGRDPALLPECPLAQIATTP